MIKNTLQAIGIVALLVVFVAFFIITAYFSYILGIGILIVSLIGIVTYALGLLNP